MNELQIAEEIFGGLCFCPYLVVIGNRTYLSARNRHTYVSDWSNIALDVWQRMAKERGYYMGVDFINREFTLTKI